MYVFEAFTYSRLHVSFLRTQSVVDIQVLFHDTTRPADFTYYWLENVRTSKHNGLLAASIYYPALAY